MNLASPWQTVGQTLGRMVPFGLSVLVLLLSVLPLVTPGFGRAGPMLMLLCVYYWAVREPEAMGPVSAFMLGLLQDILMGMPPGVSSLVLMLTQGVVATQQRFFLDKPFLVIWWALMLVALGAIVIKAVMVAALSGYGLAIGPLAVSYGLTLLVYPVLALVFGCVRMLLRPV